MSDETRNVRVVLGARSHRGDVGARVETPYDEAFVAALKAQVPASDRVWTEGSKTWWVSSAHRDAVVALVVRCYGETVVVLEDGREEYRDRSGVVATQGRLL